MASRPISPAEPSKKHTPPIQPNAHPYAIKTTSSALLSRSNSSPHYANHTRNYYVPSSPSQVIVGTRVRHRHSSSLSSVEGEGHDGVRTIPAPLPTPPSILAALPDKPSESLKGADEPRLTYRARRAETMPSSATEPITEHHGYDHKRKDNHDQDSMPEQDAALPLNPKQWNTDELTAYLGTSLGSGNDTHADILEYVRTRSLTGRELLRLTDGDLAGTPLSVVQRAQLLERSRTLRANVLRGRIYVDSYQSHEISDSSNDFYSLSTRSSTSFGSIRGASVSADDLRLLPDNNPGQGTSAFPPSPVATLHRSNSVSGASAQRYRDLARMRMRRRGRVKGLVETWERASTSGSECSVSEEGSMSGSEVESESETGPQSESILDAHRSPESSPELLHDAPIHDGRLQVMDSMAVPQEPPSLTPPLPYTHVCPAHGVVGNEEEEPSIEELLASSLNIPLKGARAWEADFGLGETVKRIPVSASTDTENPSTLSAGPNVSSGPKDDGQQSRGSSVRSKTLSVRGGTRSIGKKGKTQKRVVTAIFTGSSSDDVSKSVGDEMPLVDRRASGVNSMVRDEAPPSLDLRDDSDSALRTLEESIVATRAQVEVFRVRLEQVEADITRREVELDRAQYSDAPHSSSVFELRQRRSEASVQATVETVELPRGETLVAGAEWETMSLCDITRAIAARAMGWIFPYGRLGESSRDSQRQCQAGTHSRPGENDRYPSPAKRGRGLPLAHLSCSIIWFSFAVCAAVLRRLGFGRWIRRP